MGLIWFRHKGCEACAEADHTMFLEQCEYYIQEGVFPCGADANSDDLEPIGMGPHPLDGVATAWAANGDA